MPAIKKAEEKDCENIWSIVHEVFKSGETYAYPPQTNKAEAYKL
jgi:hypothetical protein